MNGSSRQRAARSSWHDTAPPWLASLVLHGLLLIVMALVSWTVTRRESPPVVIELGAVDQIEGGSGGDEGEGNDADGTDDSVTAKADGADVSESQTAALSLPSPAFDPAALLPDTSLTSEELHHHDPALALVEGLGWPGPRDEDNGGTAGSSGGAGGGLLGGTGGGFQKMIGGMRRQGLDITLVIDATDSMSPYIEQSKQRLRQVIAIVTGLVNVDDAGRRKSNTRFGVVAFKDYGDEYGIDATESLPLTDDTERVLKFIDEIIAGGGGDEPEPIHEALSVAGDDKMGWKTGRRAVMVLVGDAPVHSTARREAVEVAGRFARAHKGTIHVIDVGGASPRFEATRQGERQGGPARGTVLEDLARIAKAGNGSAFLLKDQQAFWRHLIVSIFGREFEQDVERIVERYGDVE